jgi:hypothetical protein
VHSEAADRAYSCSCVHGHCRISEGTYHILLTQRDSRYFDRRQHAMMPERRPTRNYAGLCCTSHLRLLNKRSWAMYVAATRFGALDRDR